MQHLETPADKKRLIEADHIAMAVDFLSSRGVELESIPIELSRAFYVDLDELNLVLEKRRALDALDDFQRRAA